MLPEFESYSKVLALPAPPPGPADYGVLLNVLPAAPSAAPAQNGSKEPCPPPGTDGPLSPNVLPPGAPGPLSPNVLPSGPPGAGNPESPKVEPPVAAISSGRAVVSGKNLSRYFFSASFDATELC